MPVRRNKRSRALLAGLVAVSTVAATTGAADTATANRNQSAATHRLPVALHKQSLTPQPTIGQPAPEEWPDTPVTINSLHRDSVGFVTLTWTMTYNGDTPDFSISTELVSVYKYAAGTISAITLTDESAKIRYNPLRADPSMTCICSDNSSIPRSLDKGQAATLYEAFKLPANVKSVTVSIPGYSPAKNIPVS